MSTPTFRPWFRLDEGFTRDGKVRETGSAWAWPVILETLKRGNGHASDMDLTDRVMHEAAQVPCAPGPRSWSVRDAFAEVGLLVQVGDHWTTPNWSEYQSDPSNADRQKRYRERNAKASTVPETVTPVTLRNVTETSRNAEKRQVTRDMTGHDVTGHDVSVTHTPTPTKPAANEDDLGTLADLETLVLDCLPPNKRRGAMFLSPVQTRDLLSLVEKYGRAAVAETLGGCGGADMPLAMARKRLESAHRAPSVGPSAVEAPSGLYCPPGHELIGNVAIQSQYADQFRESERRKREGISPEERAKILAMCDAAGFKSRDDDEAAS